MAKKEEYEKIRQEVSKMYKDRLQGCEARNRRLLMKMQELELENRKLKVQVRKTRFPCWIPGYDYRRFV